MLLRHSSQRRNFLCAAGSCHQICQGKCRRTTVQSISPFYWFITLSTLLYRPNFAHLAPHWSLVSSTFVAHEKSVRPTLLNLIFSWAAMTFYCTGNPLARTTLSPKVMGCPPAIPNQSKSELRGTCVLFFSRLFGIKREIKKLRNV